MSIHVLSLAPGGGEDGGGRVGGAVEGGGS